MTRLSPAAALLLTGCSLVITDADHQARLDADGDGYIAVEHGGDDCDDAQAAVHPGADETCNDVDDDCDGDADNDPIDGETFFHDADNDGYPGPLDSIVACGPPPDGYYPQGMVADDCDDSNSAIHPGAEEVCDGVDQDCDDQVDEGVTTVVYDDEDGDDYGETSTEHQGCADAPGVTDEPGDCNDDAPEINPGADEICGNDVDENCDDEALSCPPIDLSDARIGTGNLTGDLYGFSVAAAAGNAVVGAPGYNGDRGAAAVHVGVGSGDIGLNSGTAVFRGIDDGGYVGAAVAVVGDMLGSGGSTVAIGAPGMSSGSGAVYVLGPDHSGDINATDADAALEPVILDLDLGRALSWAGDVTGDGLDDMLVGAPGWSGNKGAAIIVAGPLTGVIDPLTGNHYWTGAATADEAGRSVAGAGDVDGDGFNDVLIGAWNAGEALQGATYLLRGPVDSDGTLSDADATLWGDAGYIAGLPVAGRGDIDGDGRSDIAIEAVGVDPDFGSVGKTFVFIGTTWSGTTTPTSVRDATAIIDQADEGDTKSDIGLGLDISADLNGDGHADLILGQPGRSGTRGGASLFFGPLEGSMSVHDANQQLDGAYSGDGAGLSVAATDVDDDGRDDLIVGAPGVDDNRGAIYVVPSSPDW